MTRLVRKSVDYPTCQGFRVRYGYGYAMYLYARKPKFNWCSSGGTFKEPSNSESDADRILLGCLKHLVLTRCLRLHRCRQVLSISFAAWRSRFMPHDVNSVSYRFCVLGSLLERARSGGRKLARRKIEGYRPTTIEHRFPPRLALWDA